MVVHVVVFLVWANKRQFQDSVSARMWLPLGGALSVVSMCRCSTGTFFSPIFSFLSPRVHSLFFFPLLTSHSLLQRLPSLLMWDFLRFSRRYLSRLTFTTSFTTTFFTAVSVLSYEWVWHQQCRISSLFSWDLRTSRLIEDLPSLHTCQHWQPLVPPCMVSSARFLDNFRLHLPHLRHLLSSQPKKCWLPILWQELLQALDPSNLKMTASKMIQKFVSSPRICGPDSMDWVLRWSSQSPAGQSLLPSLLSLSDWMLLVFIIVKYVSSVGLRVCLFVFRVLLK